MTSFSVTETSVYFWMYVALLLIIYNRYCHQTFSFFEQLGKARNIMIVALAALITFSLSYLAVLNFNSLRADHHFFKAKLSFLEKRYIDMYGEYLKALELNRFEKYYQRMFVSEIIDSLSYVNSEEYKKQVVEYIRNYITLDKPRHFDYFEYLKIARAYSVMGEYLERGYYKMAEDIFSELNASSPFMPDVYKSWGKHYIAQKEYRKAVTILRQGLTVLPSETDPFYYDPGYILNRRKAEEYKISFHLLLAFCYQQRKDPKQAVEEYKKILSYNPYLLQIYKNIADIYYLDKNISAAIKYNERALMLNPDNYQWHLNLYHLYREKKENSMAERYLLAAKALNSELK